MSKVLCIGSAGKDIFLPTKEGVIINTPQDLLSQKKLAFELGGKHYIEDRYEAMGGCALNISVGLSRRSVDACVYALVGDDHDGEWVAQELAKEGVNCTHLHKKRGAHTDMSAIIVDENSGERTIFVNRDIGEHLTIDVTEIPTDVEWFFVGSLYGASEHNMHAVLQMIALGGQKLAYNPGQHNITDHYDVVREMIRNTHILYVNKDEATEIVAGGTTGYNKSVALGEEELLERLYGMGAQIVVLTDGKRGAWCFDGEKREQYSANPSTVTRDTTGAGDAFSSGFFAAFLQKQSLALCMQEGAENANHVVRFYGAQEGLLNKERITHEM